MSLDELAKSVGGVVDRNRFLARLSVVTLGFAGVAGLAPSKAYALWSGHGCTLCGAPGSCGPQLDCAWCWVGNCHNDSGLWRRHNCCEGYHFGSSCSGGCPAMCSWYSGTIGC